MKGFQLFISSHEACSLLVLASTVSGIVLMSITSDSKLPSEEIPVESQYQLYCFHCQLWSGIFKLVEVFCSFLEDVSFSIKDRITVEQFKVESRKCGCFNVRAKYEVSHKYLRKVKPSKFKVCLRIMTIFFILTTIEKLSCLVFPLCHYYIILHLHYTSLF